MVINIMAQNSKEETKAYSENCPIAILNAIPNHCKKISFAQLKAGDSYKDKAIIGKIFLLNPLGKRINGFIRKLIITDALSNPEEVPMKLTVFLLDKFAQDSEAAHVDGFIIITNFLLENSTYKKENEVPFQVLVKKEESQVLFGNKVSSPAPGSSSNPKQARKNCATDKDTGEHIPKKRKKVQSEEESHVILSNHYDYVPLGELQETELRVSFNVYGVVDQCSLKIIQLKRTQILDLVLTDETETGFTCSIFAAKDEIFPDVYPGDIIRIHRMQVYKFRSRLKGKCLSPKFILVFSKCNKGNKPRTVAKSFTYTSTDSARVAEMFEWYNKKSEPKLISEINRGDFANIVCQVIGVYRAKTSDTVILKIWDGTKTNQLESTHWGLKEEVLDEKLFLIAKNYYVILSVYGQHAASAAELKPGQFIEVRDAHLYSPKLNQDDCKLCLHSGTKEDRGIQVLSNEDERVMKLKERLEKIFVDLQTFGNDTEDLLCQNNSVFLNCDISQYASSQRSTRNDEEAADIPLNASSQRSAKNDEEAADIEALNRPLSSNDDSMLSQITVISVVDAAVKPGQCTQEFGESAQKEFQEMDISEENRISVSSEPDPVLNKTPVEFRMFLHNPPSQPTPSFFPFTNDTEEEWWNSVPTVSETDGHSTIKPSSLAEVIQHEVPYKFRILCVVMSYEPNTTSILQIIHLCCPKCLYITKDAMPSIPPFEERDGLFYFYCPECSTDKVDKQNWPVLEYVFLIGFDLHDGTGPSTLEVQLWRENAVKFFKGISPEQALKDKGASDSILNMLWSICPNCKPYNSSETKENNYTAYPILDCCVLSYTTPGGTCYQMFDTKLK